MEGDLGNQEFSAAEGRNAQESGSESICSFGSNDHLRTGYLYEISHRHLPTNSRNKLKTIRVVMVVEKNELDVLVKFPSSSSLHKQVSTRKQPDLDEKYVMDLGSAKKALVRKISPSELQEQTCQQSFWLVSQNTDEIPTSTGSSSFSSLASNAELQVNWRREDFSRSVTEKKKTQCTASKREKLKPYYDKRTRVRYKFAEVKMLKIMKQLRAMYDNPIPKHLLRSKARKHIGDASLVDYLLKHMAGRVAPNKTERFCMSCNADGARVYWLESADKDRTRTQEKAELGSTRRDVQELTPAKNPAAEYVDGNTIISLTKYNGGVAACYDSCLSGTDSDGLWFREKYPYPKYEKVGNVWIFKAGMEASQIAIFSILRCYPETTTAHGYALAVQDFNQNIDCQVQYLFVEREKNRFTVYEYASGKVREILLGAAIGSGRDVLDSVEYMTEKPGPFREDMDYVEARQKVIHVAQLACRLHPNSCAGEMWFLNLNFVKDKEPEFIGVYNEIIGKRDYGSARCHRK